MLLDLRYFSSLLECYPGIPFSIDDRVLFLYGHLNETVHFGVLKTDIKFGVTNRVLRNAEIRSLYWGRGSLLIHDKDFLSYKAERSCRTMKNCNKICRVSSSTRRSIPPMLTKIQSRLCPKINLHSHLHTEWKRMTTMSSYTTLDTSFPY